MNKKLLSLVLALVMCLGLCAPAFASNAAEAKPAETEYVTINAGEKEGKDSLGNVYQLSNPVIKVEEREEADYDFKYTCVVVPVGTTVTLISADGTTADQVWGADFKLLDEPDYMDNPYTFSEPATVRFAPEIPDDTAELTVISLVVSAVEADEAGDTTPAPDAKPDETKPEDAKPDDAKPDDAKPDETKPDETTPDETKPDETKPVENPFTDVKEGDYFYEPVLWAVEKEITTGTTDTTFTPERNCTVSEILTFLWRAAGSPEAAIENPYTDGTESAWYADAAIWAHEKGMITGETFPADEPCTRASTAVYLWQAAGSPEAGKAAEFTDVAADADYAAAVAWAVENAVTTGTSETTFSPDSTCTRGQIATFLYRAFADQQ